MREQHHTPIYNTTKPYSQGRSNAQRPLMYPDELLRLDNAREIVLFRGQNPLMLYKIIPDELPAFGELKLVRVVEYTPEWRKQEIAQKERAAKAPKAPPPEPVTFVTQPCDQPSFFDAAPKPQAETPAQTSAQESAPTVVSEQEDMTIQRFTYVSVKPTTIKDEPHTG